MQVEQSPSDLLLLSSLQQALRQERSLKDSEHMQKSKLRQYIEDELRRYYTFQLNVLRRTLNPKIRLSEEDVFGDSYNFVKQVLLFLSKDYKLMLHLLYTNPKDANLRLLVPAIVNILYQNPVDDDFSSKSVTRLVASVAISSLRNQALPIEQHILAQFTFRPQCRRYGQIVGKSLLLKILEEAGTSGIDNVAEQMLEKLPTGQINQSFTMSQIGNISMDIHQTNLLKNFVQILAAEEFHVPVCLKGIFKVLEMEIAEQIGQDALYSFIWKVLLDIYHSALVLPSEMDKNCPNNKILEERMEHFKSTLSALKDFSSLPEHLKSEVKIFIQMILSLPPEVVARLRDPISTGKLSIYSSCLSIKETVILMDLILKTPKVKELNPKVASRVSRIAEMSENFSLFGKGAALDEVYCIFSELTLPKSIDMDYQKEYNSRYNDDKPKSLIRQILTTIEPLQVYLLKHPVHSFHKLLEKIQSDAEDENHEQGSSSQDRVAFVVNIKYFRWLVKENVDLQARDMLEETHAKVNKMVEIAAETKKVFGYGLFCLRGYAERARQIDSKVKLTMLHVYTRTFLNQAEFKFCVSSPSSREAEFHTMGKLVLLDHQRIHIQKWDNCVHHKLSLKSPLNSLMHVTNFNQFITAFCSLTEVKQSIILGQDRVSINTNLFWYLGHICDFGIQHNSLKNNPKGCKDYIETIATRTIHSLVFPINPSEKDLKIWSQLRKFRWLKPQHLGMNFRQVPPLWELTNKYLTDLNIATSTQKKLDFLKEFMKVINGILLADQKPEGKIQSIILYALLKSQQKQLASNIHFMEIYTDPARMLSGQGALITTLKSAILLLKTLSYSQLVNITQQEYDP